MKFKLESTFAPTGDQPEAIDKLTDGVKRGYHHQTLLGVTGSGKTFTMANVIANIGKPTLVVSHNKTLAAQLANEFRVFFPKNAVHYFVSYYDYYQPEAYIPRTDTYIEKDVDINKEIERMRHASTQSLLTRHDVIVVASVSCIYGLGAPEKYSSTRIRLEKNKEIMLDDLLKELTEMQYERNDIDFTYGRFRLKGDTIDIFPIYGLFAVRIELFGNRIEKISEFDPISGEKIAIHNEVDIFPATHYVTLSGNINSILAGIKEELNKQVKFFEGQNKPLEAERIKRRTNYDMEMIKETGYCSGIENYSRYLDGRKPGEPPFTLLDYFPRDYLMFIDESHMTIPQIGGMYAGDYSRKKTLVDFGFRLPSAFDNRPLRFGEFEQRTDQMIYVSATPADYEKKKSSQIVEQLVRPTGLLDPEIDVRPSENQIDDLISEIKKRTKNKQRVLVTTLTKKMAEDLSEYLSEAGVKVHYLHSEIATFERLDILRDLRKGVYDVIVGINLLREGLDLPEVSLVAILDADKEGFLRSGTPLIQTMGRAARHSEGKVIMYADNETLSMKKAIEETERRRKFQIVYNKKHKIIPQSIKKEIKDIYERKAMALEIKREAKIDFSLVPKEETAHVIKELENQMDIAARNLEFEKAALLRDQIKDIRMQIDKKEMEERIQKKRK